METMNRKILAELGDYLLARREEIIGEWLRAVERNPDIESSDDLRYRELVDHMPELCQQLAELLKNPQSDEERREVSGRARMHGKYRWRQGYKLEEVIREASIVRRVFFQHWVDAFARQVPEFDGETRKTAETIIHQAVDDVVSDSATQFVREQQKATNSLNAELADTLAELRQQKAQAEAANRAKDKFFAMLSHELRTPLTPILLWANATLEDGHMDADFLESVRMVRRNVELEVSLIDDLLDVARIAGGKLHLQLQLADASSVLRDAVEMVKSEAAQKGLEVRLDLSATNHLAMVDRARLQQVFWNVLKNAQKFTPRDGTISVRSFNRGREKLVFEITDTGKGIEADLLPKIFGAFEQGLSSTEGLGLGLAICKGIMDMHGGSIYATSQGRGMGSTFTIELNTAQNETKLTPAVPSS
jgi:Osmosensitive K+ channel histidine kinase